MLNIYISVSENYFSTTCTIFKLSQFYRFYLDFLFRSLGTCRVAIEVCEHMCNIDVVFNDCALCIEMSQIKLT